MIRILIGLLDWIVFVSIIVLMYLLAQILQQEIGISTGSIYEQHHEAIDAVECKGTWSQERATRIWMKQRHARSD